MSNLFSFFRSSASEKAKKSYREIDNQQAQALLAANPPAEVLDVRTALEYKRGHLENARHIDWLSASFGERIKTLDRSKTYLVYCRTGNRSGQACALMQRHGFEQLYNLEGGISDWTGKVVK